jgi:alcohol dehydrogenase (cytochrome c)
MMTIKKLLVLSTMVVAPVLVAGQGQGGVDPASLVRPLANEWATYSGDYTGRRYSALTQINQTNVTHLSLAWVGKVTAGAGTGGGGGGRGGGGGGGVIVGGEGSGEFAANSTANIKGAILKVGDVLYVSAPDNAWALDARDGRELWHYYWKTKGGTHIGNRGLAMWNNYLYMETPDDYLVSLDARTGKERWHVEIADFDQQYFSTPAPIVVGNHVLVGTGNDLDQPGFLQAFDPETGRLQWKFFTVPMKAGDPGLDTWPNLDSAKHGGGQVWIPGVYDPETKFYIFGTGNPRRVTPAPRGRGTTCSRARSSPSTSRPARWRGTTRPRRTTHTTGIPRKRRCSLTASSNGRPRKVVSTASRNGFFFTVDRTNGEPIASGPVRQHHELGEGVAPQRVASARFRKGSDDCRIARLAGRGRGHQLATARVFSGHRALLRAGAQRLQHSLPDRSRSARINGPRRQDGREHGRVSQFSDGD